MNKKKAIRLIVASVVILLLVVISYLILRPVKWKATIEVGEEFNLNIFLKKENPNAYFYSSVDSIDTSVLGEYDIIIGIKDRKYHTKLKVVDTVAPKAIPMENIITTIDNVPPASSCVDTIDDKTAVHVEYKETPDFSKPGEYTVTLLLSDAGGNESELCVSIMVVEHLGDEKNEDAVNLMADEILDDITTSKMSDLEKSFEIYKWVNENIAYTGYSDKENWIVAAYDAFTLRSGDCYTYFAAAKALLQRANIQSIDVKKSEPSVSAHYWSLVNVGSGWYHFDCTPRVGEGDHFFLVTDEELEKYSVAHGDSHIFESGRYPARATESIQSQVDYENGELKLE